MYGLASLDNSVASKIRLPITLLLLIKIGMVTDSGGVVMSHADNYTHPIEPSLQPHAILIDQAVILLYVFLFYSPFS